MTALAREAPLDWAKGCAASSHTFYRIGTHPAILDVVSELLGDNVLLWGAGMPTRPPGVVHHWHSDIESATAGAPTLSVWIGIANTSVESSLRLISHSHRLGTTLQEERQRHGMQRREVRTEDVVRWASRRDSRCRLITPDMSDGEAIFFDGRLWHHSRNESAATRHALLFQYAVPEAEIRIPHRRGLEWPFEPRKAPRPACVMIKGRDVAGVNRLVDPPAPAGRKHRGLLPSLVQPFRIPLPPGSDGWKRYPVFGGRLKQAGCLSCHVSTLSAGRCPHAPHRHEAEELLVVLSGKVELTLPDLPVEERPEGTHLERGDFVYYPAHFSHTLTSISPEPANYLMFKWQGTPSPGITSLEFRKHNAFESVKSHARKSGFHPTRVFQAPTRYLSCLNGHVSTLTPGGGYEPHIDAYDVAIVLLQGEIETAGERLEDNGIMYFPAGEPHGLRNPGETVAVYLVFEFHMQAKTSMPVIGERRSEGAREPAPPSGARGTRPIFVIGCGRSGTTMVQRIVNAAPGTAVFGEHNGFLRPLAEAYFAQQSKGCFRPAADDAQLRDEVLRRLKDPTAWPGWLNPYRREDLDRHYASFIADCINPDWIAAPRWGFKEIRYGASDRVVEMLLELFPNSRFVFVARNPVDTIASQRLCAFGEFEALLNDWISSNEAYLACVEDYPDQCHLVRYEDLVGSPAEAVAGLYDWLELEGASAGTVVVGLPEGRYQMRANGRMPRELLSSDRLSRIFTEAYSLARRLGLTMPIQPKQTESVAVGLSRAGARIGPFSNEHVILCDAPALALWVLCDGRRDLAAIESEMSGIVSADEVFAALRKLLLEDAITLTPKG